MGGICSRCCGRALEEEPGLLANEQQGIPDAHGRSKTGASFVSVGTFNGSQCCSFVSAMTGIVDPEDVDRPGGLFSNQGLAVRERISTAISAAYAEGTTAAKEAIAGGARDPIAPWRDLSSAGVADCWLRTVRKPVATTTILCSVRSANQVPRLLLLNVDEARSTVAGSLMLMTDMETWPSWMPLCQSVSVLERWGPNETLSRVELKLPVLGIRIESMVYSILVDRLDEEGYLEFRACTPQGAIATRCDKEYAAEAGDLGEVPEPSFKPGDASEEFDTFLGAHVPKGGRFTIRGEIDCASLRMYPTGDGEQEYTLLMQADEKCPMDSVVNQVWKMLSRQLMGIIVKKVSTQKPLDVSAERLEYFAALERRIGAAWKRRTAA